MGKCHMGVNPKIGVVKPPKMDGLFHGKPYEQMDDLGGFPIIFGLTPIYHTNIPYPIGSMYGIYTYMNG